MQILSAETSWWCHMNWQVKNHLQKDLMDHAYACCSVCNPCSIEKTEVSSTTIDLEICFILLHCIFLPSTFLLMQKFAERENRTVSACKWGNTWWSIWSLVKMWNIWQSTDYLFLWIQSFVGCIRMHPIKDYFDITVSIKSQNASAQCQLHCGVVLAMLFHSKMAPDSNLCWFRSVWSLHVLPLSAWLLPRFAGFLPKC